MPITTYHLGQKVRDTSDDGIYYRVDDLIGTIVTIFEPDTCEPERGPLYEIDYGEGPGENLGYGFLGMGVMRSYADEIEPAQTEASA